MRSPVRRRLVAAGTALAALALLGLTPWAWLRLSTRDARVPATSATAPVALVLGAGVNPDGSPTLFLAERVSLAVDLYRRGQVRALLMSGDNSRTDYDEVGTMARLAQEQGVPASAVVTDHAGFDTYSSCYRATHVFGVRRLVVVTQPFHLPRAVWLCRELGIDAVGVAPPASPVDATTAGEVREVPAAAKAVLDVVTGRTPMFPGPREHSLDAVVAAG